MNSFRVLRIANISILRMRTPTGGSVAQASGASTPEMVGNSVSASSKDAGASANRVPRGMTISLFGSPDHRDHPHPLIVIRHRDQLLLMAAPFDVASHAEKRPTDLAEGLGVVPADRVLAAAAGTWAWLRLARWPSSSPDRRHGRSGASRTGIATRRLWHWLLEAGSGGGVRVWQIRQPTEGHSRGDRRRSVLMLPSMKGLPVSSALR